LVHFAQVNIGGVFEDEPPHVLLVDEIDIAVLLLSSRRTAKLGFQVAAPDPSRHGMGINSQCLCETVRRIEAPVVRNVSTQCA